MAASPGEGDSITVHGDTIVSRVSGRIRKPSAKVRVIQPTLDRRDHADLKNEIKELSTLIQELIRRDADREQLLKDFSKEDQDSKERTSGRKTAFSWQPAWARVIHPCIRPQPR